jgi:hypothetical protein
MIIPLFRQYRHDTRCAPNGPGRTLKRSAGALLLILCALGSCAQPGPINGECLGAKCGLILQVRSAF